MAGRVAAAKNYVELLSNVLFRSGKENRPILCDSVCLRLHYRWTFGIFMGSFVTVWYSWYYQHVIECRSHYNAQEATNGTYLNLCLSYPYVVDKATSERRYLLFYRWIPWIFLLLAGAFYLPRNLVKFLDSASDRQTARYMEEDDEQQLVDYLLSDAARDVRVCAKMFVTHATCLLLDVGFLIFVDFCLLDGRFLYYGYEAYPFRKDPRDFTDVMSSTFPPFVLCQITAETHGLMGQRNETYACHLPLMELYEKIFLGLWMWIIICLMILTTCHLTLLAIVSCVGPFLYGGDGNVHLMFLLKMKMGRREFGRVLNQVRQSQRLKTL